METVQALQQILNQTPNDEDETKLTSPIDRELTDIDTLMRERNLDPEDWEVTNFKVNEWDGPLGEPCKQLTIHGKRKRYMYQPAWVPDDYVAPKVKHELLYEKAKLVVMVGDQQAPYHDPILHQKFLEWLNINQPHQGVLMGDTVDFPNISRHAPNPEWDKSAQECVNAAYLVLREYVQADEGCEWTKLVGNHDERIRSRLLNLYTNLYGLRRADVPDEDPEGPALCVSNLLRLKELGIEYIDPKGGYAHAQKQVSPLLAARHGWLAKKGSGASALTTLEHLGYSVVVGHTHRQSLVHKTTHDINGATTTLAAAETGCMCQIKDGLGYTVAPDWQNGFATAEVYDDGTFKIDLATFVNGTLYWRDQRF